MNARGVTDGKGMCKLSKRIELRSGEGMEGQDVEGVRRRRWIESVEWKSIFLTTLGGQQL